MVGKKVLILDWQAFSRNAMETDSCQVVVGLTWFTDW